MKKLVIIFSVFLGLATGISAQDMNKKVFDEKSQTDILVGNCTREGLLGVEFANSYNEEYPAYNPNGDVIIALKEKVKGVKCVIVLGTWCGDSKEQVPRFLKIDDLLGNLFEELKIISVDRNKEAPEMNIKEKYLIEKVPTFIFYRGDTEIGRITETPKESLEKDLLEILKAK
ncbi:MAG: thioredoxin family protein [Bacteroidota bacterium]